ncbi:MAG: hypothetical protein HC814_03020 [Rhodobacteraceae bacterium]|nr:hypothetical protein [Paracoccaceae bacterium]
MRWIQSQLFSAISLKYACSTLPSGLIQAAFSIWRIDHAPPRVWLFWITSPSPSSRGAGQKFMIEYDACAFRSSSIQRSPVRIYGTNDSSG